MNAVVCPQCGFEGRGADRSAAREVDCEGCRRAMLVVALPALDQPVERPRLAVTAGANEAACYKCPDKKAVGVCQSCGSFTCSSCEVEWFGERLCLGCVHTLREVKKDSRFRSRCTLYDNIALMLIIGPILLVPFYMFAILLSPVALFLVLRYRKSSRGIVPRGPFRLIATGVLATLLLCVGLAGVGMVIWTSMEASATFEDVVTPVPTSGGPAPIEPP